MAKAIKEAVDAKTPSRDLKPGMTVRVYQKLKNLTPRAKKKKESNTMRG